MFNTLMLMCTGSEEEMNAVLNEMDKDEDIEPPKKRAKKDNNKENKPTPKRKQKQTSTSKKGKQPGRKRGEKKAPGAVGAEENKDNEQKNSDIPTSLPSKPTPPTGDDGKQRSNKLLGQPRRPPPPPVFLHLPLPPPPSTLYLTRSHLFHLYLLCLSLCSMTRKVSLHTHLTKMMYLTQVSK